MLVVIHLECTQCMLRGLGQVGLPEVNVQLVDKLTPITLNRQFRVCDQSRLPPEHGDVREVRGSKGQSLVVSCKLVRPTVKGHDTADDERVQLRRVPTSELVGLGCL